MSVAGIDLAGAKSTNEAGISDSFKAQIEAAEKERKDAVWIQEAKSKLLDLSTSHADVLDYMMNELQDDNLSPAREFALQYLIGLRNKLVQLVSNLIRTIFDGGNVIISNMRS